MKAWLYEGKKSFRLIDRPQPEAGPGEVVVKIALCGICGTDIEMYFDGILPPGITPGHENVGEIAEVGEGVEGFKTGDRVAVAAPPDSCGRCYQCLHGRPNLCAYGFESTPGLRQDGGMAEYLLVGDPRQLHLLPDHLPFEDAVLMDSMAVALRGVLQSAFKIGDNVVVSGAGSIGLSAVQVLKLGGAKHVTALDVVPEKRELAGDYGADLVLDPTDEGDALAGRLAELYGGVGADLVFECAGAAKSLETCLGLAKRGGQVVILGHGPEPVPVAVSMMILQETSIVSSLAYTADEARLCIGYLADGRLRAKGMLSDVIPLEELVDKGFERLAADRSLVKVAVAP